jgi:exonuclease SbcC
VFSVFIGDEIDASMDEDRARNLQMSLVNIADRISQIILVTHKVPQAKHVVLFGDRHG